MRVARVDVAPRVDDRDDRLALVVGARVAHLRRARAMAERAHVVRAEPAMRAQFFRLLARGHGDFPWRIVRLPGHYTQPMCGHLRAAAGALYWRREPASGAAAREREPRSTAPPTVDATFRRSPWLSRLSAMPPAGALAPALLLTASVVLAASLAPTAGHAAAPERRIEGRRQRARCRPTPRSSSSRSSRSRRARCPTRAAARRSARSAKARASSSATTDSILTIGYLIVEADEVSLVDQQGTTLPARVVGYDHATGLRPRARRRAARRRRRCRSAIRRSSPSAIR